MLMKRKWEWRKIKGFIVSLHIFSKDKGEVSKNNKEFKTI